MKKAVALMAVVLSLGMTVALDAEAKRLGGARSSGMQRQAVTQPQTPPAAQPHAPASPGAPAQAAPTAANAAAAAPAAAAAKRSWVGPLAGLAAGLGLAALASHLGFGEAMANIMLIALIGMAVMALVAFVMRKRAAGAPSPVFAGAGAGAGAGATSGGRSLPGTRIGSALGEAVAQPQAAALPADFDAAAFVRNAKSQFMALQAANDARDLQSLRDYLTPEMFEVVREEVQSRGDTAQRTEVFGLEAQVLEVVEEADRYIVSVRFTGSVREQAGAVPEDLDEVWHLSKPRTGFGGWQIAGIQQVASGG